MAGIGDQRTAQIRLLELETLHNGGFELIQAILPYNGDGDTAGRSQTRPGKVALAEQPEGFGVEFRGDEYVFSSLPRLIRRA